MVSQNDFIRDEMMSHVPMLVHGRVERVLILGGTGGGLAEKVLEHRGVRSVVQVQPARAPAGVPGDERLRHESANGAAYLAATTERFDLILMDSSGWFTEDMFRDARGCLRAGGVVVARLGAPCLQARAFSTDMRNLSAVFSRVAAYLLPVPGTFGGPVALGWGSSVLAPDAVAEDVLAERFADSRIETRYYTPEVHRAAFALPRFVDQLIAAATCPRVEIAADELERVLEITGHHTVPGVAC